MMKLKFFTRCIFKGKCLYLLAGCMLSLSALNAQSITWAIVNAAGFVDGPEGSLRWTIGEPLTLEVQGETARLRVGFLPFAIAEEVSAVSVSLDPDIDITISPNPASDQIHVQVPGEDAYLVRILSLDGAAKFGMTVTYETDIDIRTFPAGAYVLYAITKGGAFNSKTFIKS